jgi:hypothetical protein
MPSEAPQSPQSIHGYFFLQRRIQGTAFWCNELDVAIIHGMSEKAIVARGQTPFPV